MPITLEQPIPGADPDQPVICTLSAGEVQVSGLATDVHLFTDDVKSMSYAQLEGKSFWITEIEADALTVAGAVDKRHHVMASDPGSVI